MQIFKVTPWFAFLILFLSLKDRLSFYSKRKVARTLDVDQGRKQSLRENFLPALSKLQGGLSARGKI